MCGIIGYISKNRDAKKVLLDGIRRLEYRGYDSAGLALMNDGKVISQKAVGKVENLVSLVADLDFPSSLGIIHTRWATHGGITESNAHPHSDCSGKIWLAHNGIIENYSELKAELIAKQHHFRSQTDTEVIAHLIEEETQKTFSFENACRQALKKLRGSYALVIFSNQHPALLIGARLGSPLTLGIAKDGFMLASDCSPISACTNKVVYLEEKEMITLDSTAHQYVIRSIQNGKKIIRRPKIIDTKLAEADKLQYPNFMLKEIFEAPQTVKNAISGRIKNNVVFFKEFESKTLQKKIRSAKRILISACGTAYYAGLIAKYMIEEIAGIPVETDIASEWRYRSSSAGASTMMLVISQSGETADTLGALKLAKEKKIATVGIVNAQGSTIARGVDAALYNFAGPEIGVASTKAFISQIALIALFANWLKPNKKIISELQKIPSKIESVLKSSNSVRKLANKYKMSGNFLYLGRKYSYPVALEGALKLKEISYIHAEGYAAGEMKHGPLALIDKNFPSVFIAPIDSVYEKTLSNIEEVKSRGGSIIAIATDNDKKIKNLANDVIYVPRAMEILSPFLTVIPLQLFAYYIGVLKGYDVDKPRNLAKSVTVE